MANSKIAATLTSTRRKMATALTQARRKIVATSDRLSSKKGVKYTIYSTAILLFLALILLPPILGIFIKWGTVQQVLNKPELVARALVAVQNSFTIAILVSVIDLVTGIPMAWLIARRKGPWISILDTLADIPFVVPTAVL